MSPGKKRSGPLGAKRPTVLGAQKGFICVRAPALLGARRGLGRGGAVAFLRPCALRPIRPPVPFPFSFPGLFRALRARGAPLCGASLAAMGGAASRSSPHVILRFNRWYSQDFPSTVKPYCSRSKSLCTKSSRYWLMLICRACARPLIASFSMVVHHKCTCAHLSVVEKRPRFPLARL